VLYLTSVHILDATEFESGLSALASFSVGNGEEDIIELSRIIAWYTENVVEDRDQAFSMPVGSYVNQKLLSDNAAKFVSTMCSSSKLAFIGSIVVANNIEVQDHSCEKY